MPREHEVARAEASKGLFPRQAKQAKKFRNSVINVEPTGRHRQFNFMKTLQSNSQWPS